jgi:ABC-2 type transport system permease protein
MTSQKLIALFKREFHENKTGFFTLPLIISTVWLITACALIIWAASALHSSSIKMNGTLNMGEAAIELSTLTLQSAFTPEKKTLGAIVAMAVGSNALVLAFVLGIVFIVYAHNGLYNDRKDRTILFWRSMPVSETTNVLIKLATTICYTPILLFLISIPIALATTITGLLAFTLAGASFTDVLISTLYPGALLLPLQILIQGFVFGLIIFPITAFIFLCASAAKKSPVLISALVPNAALLIDRLLQHKLGINLQIFDMTQAYINAMKNGFQAFSVFHSHALHSNTITILTLATALGAACIASAIWLRNHRYEI